MKTLDRVSDSKLPPEWSAFAPDKEAWKRDGNFFSAEELRQMDADDDIRIYQPQEKILIAD